MSANPLKRTSANQGVNKRNIFVGNLIGGIAWGLGTVIGASIIVGIIVWMLNTVGLFDYFKDFLPQNSYSIHNQSTPTPSP